MNFLVLRIVYVVFVCVSVFLVLGADQTWSFRLMLANNYSTKLGS